jgi:hypothetical protein
VSPRERLRRRAVVDQVIEDAPVPADRRRDVAGADVVAALDHERRLPRGQELGHDLALLALANDRIVDVVAALGQHPLDQVAELRQRLDRRARELGFQRLELAFPFVPIEAGLGRRHRASLLAP